MQKEFCRNGHLLSKTQKVRSDGSKACSACLSMAQKKYLQASPEARNKAAKRHQKWYLKNQEKMRQKRRERYENQKQKRGGLPSPEYLKAKDEVLRYYSSGSMKCGCCGIVGVHFLTIDHINGKRNGDGRSGYRLYRYLIKNNFPEGYQVLCWNCNGAKRTQIECPHETQRRLKIEQIKKIG